jgi:hypothetical protein
MGLIIKALPPASIIITDAPNDIGPLAWSRYIMKLPFFDVIAQCYAQDLFIIGQWVQVISGEQQGLVRHSISITDGVVDVQPEDNDIPLLQVPLEQLLPIYRPSNHVKGMWSDERSIVMSSKKFGLVSFIDTCTQEGVSAYSITLIVANYTFQFTTHIYFDAIHPTP